MKPEKSKSSAEYDPQQIENLVSNFERIAKETKARGTLAGGDIHSLTNFLLLLRDSDCIGIKFSREQVERIREAYSLLNVYYPVPENPIASFEVLRQIMAARVHVEYLVLSL